MAHLSLTSLWFSVIVQQKRKKKNNLVILIMLSLPQLCGNKALLSSLKGIEMCCQRLCGATKTVKKLKKNVMVT